MKTAGIHVQVFDFQAALPTLREVNSCFYVSQNCPPSEFMTSENIVCCYQWHEDDVITLSMPILTILLLIRAKKHGKLYNVLEMGNDFTDVKDNTDRT